MEKYVIPFEYNEKAYYAVIISDLVNSQYLLQNVHPPVNESLKRHIPLQEIRESRAVSGPTPPTLYQAVLGSLVLYLQAHSWPVNP